MSDLFLHWTPEACAMVAPEMGAPAMPRPRPGGRGCVRRGEDVPAAVAPPEAVSALADCYSAAQREVRVVPGDGGGRAIGHLGFFRAKVGEAPWPRAAEWLARAAATGDVG